MILMWLAQVALAGQVYVNGTLVNPAQLAGTTMDKVTVTFDAAGNVQVSAPGYKIEVMGAPPAPTAQPYTYTPPPAPTGTYPVASGTYPPPVAASATAGTFGTYGNTPGMHASGVAKAQWWLATEDNGSMGHLVEVVINDQLAQTIRSGEPLRLMDIGQYLKPGANDILIKSNSQGAGGGTMYVYIGTGSDQSGTVVMDAPQVQYGLGASRTGAAQRDYTVTVR